MVEHNKNPTDAEILAEVKRLMNSWIERNETHQPNLFNKGMYFAYTELLRRIKYMKMHGIPINPEKNPVVVQDFEFEYD